MNFFRKKPTVYVPKKMVNITGETDSNGNLFITRYSEDDTALDDAVISANGIPATTPNVIAAMKAKFQPDVAAPLVQSEMQPEEQPEMQPEEQPEMQQEDQPVEQTEEQPEMPPKEKMDGGSIIDRKKYRKTRGGRKTANRRKSRKQRRQRK